MRILAIYLICVGISFFFCHYVSSQHKEFIGQQKGWYTRCFIASLLIFPLLIVLGLIIFIADGFKLIEEAVKEQ